MFEKQSVDSLTFVDNMDSSTAFTASSTFQDFSRQGNVSIDTEELLQKLNAEMTRAVLPVTVFVGIEAFAAFFGNMLVIYVFLFKYHDCNFRYFVLCLAFTDITSSLTTMPGEMVTQLNWYVYPVPEICKIKSFFNVFTVASEALCLLTIGFDRYLKVCRPLNWQIKPKQAKYICGIIYFLAFVLAIPVYIFWGTHTSEKKYNNATINVTVCEKDERWLHTDHPLQYSVAVEIILSICLIVMFGLYVFIAKTLLQNKRIRFRAYTVRQRIPAASVNTSSNPIGNISTTEISDSGYSLPSEKMQDNRIQNTNGETNRNEKQRQEIRDETTAEETFPELETNNENLDGRQTNDCQDTRQAQTQTLSHLSTGRQSNVEQSTLQRSEHRHTLASRIRTKTLIMFILTVVFIITTILYLTLLSYIAESILDTLSESGKAVYFFFFRLYFINHVINPIVYGLLDPHFRELMKHTRNALKSCVSNR